MHRFGKKCDFRVFGPSRRPNGHPDRGQKPQAAPALTQEILIPWGGLQPPHSNFLGIL